MVNGVNETAVADHYTVNGLGTLILDALQASGINLNTLSPIDLAPVDEFHIGGRAATQHVIGMMHLPSGAHVLDVGSCHRIIFSYCDSHVRALPSPRRGMHPF